MQSQNPVLIAGAGVGGLTAALALHQRGVPVRLYERRSAEAIRTAAGSGLTLWSNASTVLGWLGLADRLLAVAETVVAIHSFDTHGHVRFRMDSGRHVWPDALPSLSIGRMDLAEVLMGECAERGVPVCYGRAVTGFVDTPDGVRVTIDDTDEVEGAALVGADGIRSAVLRRLHGTVPEIYLGRTVYRGVVPGTADLPAHTPQLFHDQPTGIGGGVYPIGGDRAAWTLSAHAPAGQREEPRQRQAHATELARTMPAMLADRVERTPAEAVVRTDIWYHEWHEPWGHGHVTLLGDAAHAMPNDLGQGACQAVEDAVVLADALADADSTTGALRDYERRRYARVRWVREQSVRIATAPEPANPAVRWLMTRLTRLYLAAMEKQMWREMQRLPQVSGTPTTPTGRAA